MSLLFISIIIPTYNRAHLISETLDSILKQTYTNWECILVDDGSTDETQQIADRYCSKDERFRFFQRHANRPKGANACRNYGFEKAKGNYIQWFDSDDLMHHDFLKLQLKSLQKMNKRISICNFCFFRNVEAIEITKPFNVFEGLTNGHEILSSYVSGKLVLNTQTLLMHNSIVQNVKFNEELFRAQDLDFIFRVLAINVSEVAVLDEKLCFVRRHEESITNQFKNRDFKLINSEIMVRNMIWEELKKHNFSEQTKSGALKMYLKALKYLLYAGNYSLFFKKMRNTFYTVNNNQKMLILKLSLLGLFYIFTKRGTTAYQHLINKL